MGSIRGSNRNPAKQKPNQERAALLRVFIATLLPRETILLLEQHQEALKPLWRGIKWERPEKFHITLKFLGHVEEGLLPDIALITRAAAEGTKPMEMRLKKAGCFPNLRRPRVVCFCLEGNGGLREVFNQIESGLEPLGFPREERRFVPHVTLGRARQRASLKGGLPETEESSFTIGEIAVMKSDTLPTGSVYAPLHTYKIG